MSGSIRLQLYHQINCIFGNTTMTCFGILDKQIIISTNFVFIILGCYKTIITYCKLILYVVCPSPTLFLACWWYHQTKFEINNTSSYFLRLAHSNFPKIWNQKWYEARMIIFKLNCCWIFRPYLPYNVRWCVLNCVIE